MIFVTIGSMFPFDRLIRVMDAWAAEHRRNDVLAQIGREGAYEPRNMEWVRSLEQAAFKKTVQESDLIVAHAGMGSVFMAGEFGKPIVLLPRFKEWGEHTTNHQVATARWLRGHPGIFVADQDADLPGQIDRALLPISENRDRMSTTAPPLFIARIRAALLETRR